MHPLWTQARDIIRTLFRCCGEPQDIAREGNISRKLYDHVLTWIRAGETLLRRMLLIEAHAQASPPRANARPRGGQRQRKLVTFYPDKPDDWRVHFRCCVSERRLPAGKASEHASQECRQDAGAPSAKAPKLPVLSTWPLALRAEALLRICNNPAPYIARLARVIARTFAVVARILKPPHQRKRQSGDPPHQIDIIGHELWSDLCAALPNTS